METRRFKLTVRRVGIWSTAKFGCFLGAVLYSWGVMVLLAALSPFASLALLHPRTADGLVATTPYCMGAFVAGVLGGALVGFIHWAIMAFLFNIAALMAGGIKVEFERRVHAPAPAKSKYDNPDDRSLEQQLVESGQYIRDLSASWKNPPKPRR
jgi:hypothetical protein